MMSGPVARILGSLALGLVLGAPPSRPPPQPSTAAAAGLDLSWDKNYGQDDRWTDFRAIATQNNEVLVGVVERDSLEQTAAGRSRLLLWRIDSTGRLTQETEITQASTTTGKTAAFRDVVALESGEAVLLIDFVAGRPSIVRAGRTGDPIVSRELFAPGRTVTLFKIVPTTGGRFLAIGHESLDAFLTLIDGNGVVKWEKKQDRGKMELFTDGLAVDDGFVLVGNSGQYDPLRSGPSIVWVGRYDANGEIKSEVTFPGRYGRIARSGTRGYAVVYDKSASLNQEIEVKGLGPQLQELWSAPLVSTTANFSDFKIAPLANGGFVVAGGKDGRSLIARLDSSGRQSATLDGAPVERSTDVGSYGLAYDGTASLTLASSRMEVRDVRNVKQKVRIRKVTIK